ncbi:MAG: hypothetical protein JWM49_2025 [Microbacteriaceae bacterium]|nr:hypothetical protein [Microbacteriaceae bacterium]
MKSSWCWGFALENNADMLSRVIHYCASGEPIIRLRSHRVFNPDRYCVLGLEHVGVWTDQNSRAVLRQVRVGRTAEDRLRKHAPCIKTVETHRRVAKDCAIVSIVVAAEDGIGEGSVIPHEGVAIKRVLVNEVMLLKIPEGYGLSCFQFSM